MTKNKGAKTHLGIFRRKKKSTTMET